MRRRPNLFAVGVVAAGAFWMVEAAIHTWVFREGAGFVGHFIPEDANEWWMRALACTLMMAFGGYAELVLRQRGAMMRERLALEAKLKEALSLVLSGYIPICARCKSIREGSEWRQLEEYVSTHSFAQFSHGLCPDCLRQYLDDDRPPG